MHFIFNCPINSLSFGNVSINLLREFYKSKDIVSVFPIGDQVDISAFDKLDSGFKNWLQGSINNRYILLNKKLPTLKLWHLNGSEVRFSEKQVLYTFHELDQLTKDEIIRANFQNAVIVSSNFSQNVFKQNGVDASVAQLGFDEDFVKKKTLFSNDSRIHYGLMGKFENRKHTSKLISSWLERYGNNNKYLLTCAVTNPFLPEDKFKNDIYAILNGKRYNNINFIPRVTTNSEVNDFLNSIDIDLGGMSGAEGWNLPSFNATCLGKWSIVLNATAHKDWANEKNSILVEPSGKISSEDGRFFVKGQPFNQGNIYDFNKNDLFAAMEKADKIAKVENVNGIALKDIFSYSKMAAKIKDSLSSAL